MTWATIPIKTNGYFGVATASALKAFQTKNALESNGEADADTPRYAFLAQGKALG